MSTNIYKIPDDFVLSYNKLNDSGNLSVNALVKQYKKSPSVISRWLSESGLHIEKTNAKIEME